MKHNNMKTKRLAVPPGGFRLAGLGVATVATILGLSGGLAHGAPAAVAAASTAGGATDHDSLAKKLANPIAAMISVPFQNNFDFGGGPSGDGVQWKMNFQPVIPFSLNKDWNLITRTTENGPEWGLRCGVTILFPKS
jgi:hypothetical protein